MFLDNLLKKKGFIVLFLLKMKNIATIKSYLLLS